jgi:hypothetical protein
MNSTHILDLQEIGEVLSLNISINWINCYYPKSCYLLPARIDVQAVVSNQTFPVTTKTRLGNDG